MNGTDLSLGIQTAVPTISFVHEDSLLFKGYHHPWERCDYRTCRSDTKLLWSETRRGLRNSDDRALIGESIYGFTLKDADQSPFSRFRRIEPQCRITLAARSTELVSEGLRGSPEISEETNASIVC